MSKKLSQIFTLVLFLAVAIFLIYQSTIRPTDQANLETQEPNQVEDREQKAPQTEYNFQANQNDQKALDLVQSQVELTLKEYPFGTMVEGANGLMADGGHYWAIYQNGEYAKTGIKEIILQEGESIQLKYEEIVL